MSANNKVFCTISILLKLAETKSASCSVQVTFIISLNESPSSSSVMKVVSSGTSKRFLAEKLPSLSK